MVGSGPVSEGERGAVGAGVASMLGIYIGGSDSRAAGGSRTVRRAMNSSGSRKMWVVLSL